jgi:hypothetical protein
MHRSGFPTAVVNKDVPIQLLATNDLTTPLFHSFFAGVFNGCNQTNPELDHGVVLVGYGTDEALGDYWLIRNSWSPTFGEKVSNSSLYFC